MSNLTTVISASLGQLESEGLQATGIFLSAGLWDAAWKELSKENPVRKADKMEMSGIPTILSASPGVEEGTGYIMDNFGTRHTFTVEPELGPYEDIKVVRQNGSESWAAFDADENYLLDLTLEGVQELRDMGVTFDLHPWEGQAVPSNNNAFKYAEPARVMVEGPVQTNQGLAPTVVDSVVLQVGDRVLVAGQPDPAKDGVYVVGGRGTWMRATKDTKGCLIVVTEGVRHGHTSWFHDEAGTIVQTTSNITIPGGHMGGTLSVSGDLNVGGPDPGDLETAFADIFGD